MKRFGLESWSGFKPFRAKRVIKRLFKILCCDELHYLIDLGQPRVTSELRVRL